jgi:F-type H+-transporting ATPase subunit a
MEIQVTGPKVYFELPFDLPDSTIFTMKNLITQTTITLFATTIILITLAFFLTRKIDKRPGAVQVLLEKVVTMLYNMVEDTMGKHNLKFAPYIGTLFVSSIIGSLIGTTQLFRSTTADLSVTMAWALVTTGMVWYQNIKHLGFKTWLKSFTEPIFIMTPMNIVSEIASPLSLAFRHFGNVAGGGVLTTLIYAALALLSNAVLGWIPGVIGDIPFFQAGIPAFLSLYFDFFSGFVQAFVFSLLTMVYVAGACPPPEEWPEERREKLLAMEAKRLAKEKH